ncbi:hypothetical protein [Pseudactinotalea sp. Z1748]|uniref:hypothetical protein n=1 Tax=Pseudactinotalea sp. Z1748 TaxID=3413027 RepID=UPI003C7C0EB9
MPGHTLGMTNQNAQPRQPGGRPTGGEFAERQRAASGINLSASAEDQHTGQTGGYHLSEQDFDHLQGLMAKLHQSARYTHPGQRIGQAWDAEDLEQEVLLQMMERARATGNITEITPAYMNSAMRNIVSRSLNAHTRGIGAENYAKVNSADLGAWREFTTRVDEIELATGRALSPTERDAVAEQIRQDWHDQRRKPTDGFHLHRHDTPMDTPESASLGHARTPSAEQAYLDETHYGPDTEIVLGASKQGGGTRKHMWNAICESRGITKQPHGVLNNRQVTAVKNTVGENEQEVFSALEEWESGLSNERTEALFRPFGAASQSHRAQIAEVMRDMPDRAAQIYSLAIAGATERNFKTRLRAAA